MSSSLRTIDIPGASPKSRFSRNTSNAVSVRSSLVNAGSKVMESPYHLMCKAIPPELVKKPDTLNVVNPAAPKPGRGSSHDKYRPIDFIGLKNTFDARTLHINGKPSGVDKSFKMQDCFKI